MFPTAARTGGTSPSTGSPRHVRRLNPNHPVPSPPCPLQQLRIDPRSSVPRLVKEALDTLPKKLIRGSVGPPASLDWSLWLHPIE